MDARYEFNSLVEEKVAAGKDRVKATREVVLENPELHARMLEEANTYRR